MRWRAIALVVALLVTLLVSAGANVLARHPSPYLDVRMVNGAQQVLREWQVTDEMSAQVLYEAAVALPRGNFPRFFCHLDGPTFLLPLLFGKTPTLTVATFTCSPVVLLNTADYRVSDQTFLNLLAHITAGPGSA